MRRIITKIINVSQYFVEEIGDRISQVVHYEHNNQLPNNNIAARPEDQSKVTKFEGWEEGLKRVESEPNYTGEQQLSGEVNEH